MNPYQKLVRQIREKKTFLCVGLDTDIAKIPDHLRNETNPLFSFNKAIIDATARHCVAYKLNFAFYEAGGPSGWEALEKTVAYIPDTHFTIADAKRGDIGNTARQYASAIFDHLSFDAVTLSPYMGHDSIEPFLLYDDKIVILLALTSNPGSGDFQFTKLTSGRYLYEEVIQTSCNWAEPDRMMYVIGATHPKQLGSIRARVPGYFFLVPGIGTQGGSLEDVCRQGFNRDVGLLVNSSRGIIYAGSGRDFAAAAGNAAARISYEMDSILSEYGITAG